MIEVMMVKVQYLNGENVIKQVPIPKNGLHFDNAKELEYYRRLKELKLQWKIEEKYRRDHPGASDEVIRQSVPMVSIIFNIKEPAQ